MVVTVHRLSSVRLWHERIFATLNTRAHHKFSMPPDFVVGGLSFIAIYLYLFSATLPAH